GRPRRAGGARPHGLTAPPCTLVACGHAARALPWPGRDAAVERRALGRTELRVAPLCLGGNVFGWTADEATSFPVLDAYVEAGGNSVDTADTYPRWAPDCRGGESEAIIGRWMRARGNRARVIVATKLGGDMGGDKKGLARGYILAEVEDSLRRLGTDYIDL